jgi:hypothetical protein
MAGHDGDGSHWWPYSGPGQGFDPTLPITIYLADESGSERVQAAVEELVGSAGAEVVERDEPVLGSWFRRLRARMRRHKELNSATLEALDLRYCRRETRP